MKPTPITHTPAAAKGMEKIGPGIYVSGKELHIFTFEICEALGLPYTEENAALVEKAGLEVARKKFGHGFEVERREI